MNVYSLTVPFVWESSHTVRFGIDVAVMRWRPANPAARLLLLRLERGATETQLRQVLKSTQAPVRVLTQMLSDLDPVLRVESSPRTLSRPRPQLRITDSCRTANDLAWQLECLGASILRNRLTGDPSPDMSLAISRYGYDTLQIATLLENVVPVLPIHYTDRSVTVGPALRERGLCSGCLLEHQRSEDQEWLSWAPQIVGKPLPGEHVSTRQVALTILLLASNKGAYSESLGVRFRLGEQGQVRTGETFKLSPHPDCGNHYPIPLQAHEETERPESSMKREGVALSPEPEILSSS